MTPVNNSEYVRFVPEAVDTAQSDPQHDYLPYPSAARYGRIVRRSIKGCRSKSSHEGHLEAVSPSLCGFYVSLYKLHTSE